MSELRARNDDPVTSWPLNDPRWHPYTMGWREGYEAARRDCADRIDPLAADDLVLKRLSALLADLRDRESARDLF